MKEKFKFLPHTADIKFQAFGEDLEDCFKSAGLALTNIICKQKINSKIKKRIKVNGRDRERLLYEFLEEIIYLLDIGDFLVGDIKNLKIKSEKNKKDRYDQILTAEFYGDDINNYQAETDVKAVTYNDMFVKSPSENKSNEFSCQVVVDV